MTDSTPHELTPAPASPAPASPAPASPAPASPAPADLNSSAARFAQVMYVFGWALAIAGFFVFLITVERELLNWRLELITFNPETPEWVRQHRKEDLYFAFRGTGEGIIWALRAWCEPTLIVAVIAAVIALETGPRRWTVPTQIVAAILLAAGAAAALKLGVPRLRPIAFPDVFGDADGWPASWQIAQLELTRYQAGSFPSSHAATGLALSGVLSRVYPSLGWVVIPLGLGGAATRFLTMSHWPTDIVVGALLGWLAAWLVCRLAR